MRLASFQGNALACRFRAGDMLHAQLQILENMHITSESDYSQVCSILIAKELVETCFLLVDCSRKLGLANIAFHAAINKPSCSKKYLGFC